MRRVVFYFLGHRYKKIKEHPFLSIIIHVHFFHPIYSLKYPEIPSECRAVLIAADKGGGEAGREGSNDAFV